MHAPAASACRVATPSAATGAPRSFSSTPFGDSDDDVFAAEGALFGADATEEAQAVPGPGSGSTGTPRESAESLQVRVLDEAEEQATEAFLASAGVSFSAEETLRIRKRAKEFAGIVKSRNEQEPVSPLAASKFAKLDPYQEFEMRRDALNTHPEVEYDWESNIIPVQSDDMVVRRRGGLRMQYCIFCYHGADLLRPENTTLLTKYQSDRGKVVPRRVSHCCAKHQRKLKRTIKRARQQQLLPFNQRLHPKLRATRRMPNPETHKPVTFTTPRDAYRAAQKYDRWTFALKKEWGQQFPQVDWFPEEE